MNPAALKANLGDLPRGADIIVNTDEFTKRNLAKVGYAANPLEDGSLDGLPRAPGRADLDDGRGARRASTSPGRRPSGRRTCSPSACCPGCTTGPTEGTVRVPRDASSPRSPRSSRPTSPPSRPAGTSARPPRTSRSATRSSRPSCRPAPTATSPATSPCPTAWSRPSQRAGLPLFLGSYPITPASDILHELSKHKRFGVRTFQAEDEIAGDRRRARRGLRRRARRDHDLGPGRRAEGRDDRPGGRRWSCRWSSSTSSAAARRPACRPRPSRPTCCRRCSAATARPRCRSSRRSSPSDCFDAALEAARIAMTYRTPVILLSDGYLANGSEPWRIPDVDDLPDLRRRVRDRAQPHDADGSTESSGPTCATRETLARPWAIPGTPGLEHRIGGIEKADGTGDISYDPANHDLMVRTRAGQGRRRSPRRSRRSRSTTPTGDARVLVLGWGSTYGPIGAACRRVRAAGHARRPGPPAPPQPVPGQHSARCCARYDRVWCRR